MVRFLAVGAADRDAGESLEDLGTPVSYVRRRMSLLTPLVASVP
jgi:hypothetical protein